MIDKLILSLIMATWKITRRPDEAMPASISGEEEGTLTCSSTPEAVENKVLRKSKYKKTMSHLYNADPS